MLFYWRYMSTVVLGDRKHFETAIVLICAVVNMRRDRFRPL